MTDVNSSIANSVHNVVVICYHPDSKLIYMDREKGYLHELSTSEFNLNYTKSITEIK